jgi:hypothetical protein
LAGKKLHRFSKKQTKNYLLHLLQHLMLLQIDEFLLFLRWKNGEELLNEMMVVWESPYPDVDAPSEHGDHQIPFLRS